MASWIPIYCPKCGHSDFIGIGDENPLCPECGTLMGDTTDYDDDFDEEEE